MHHHRLSKHVSSPAKRHKPPDPCELGSRALGTRRHIATEGMEEQERVPLPPRRERKQKKSGL